MATLLNSEEPVDGYVLAFINRLSDYLFVLARKLSYDSGASEIKWIPAKND
jgi:cob(I)alamin adenosyltransferase